MSYLASIQNEAGALARQLGLTYKDLTPAELEKWQFSFQRQFILGYPEREIVDILQRHIKELLLGAMIAKNQMNAEIDGELPAAGKVGGPLAIRAGWLGIGDDWEDGGSITTGSPQYWIHSGTTLLGGTSGRPIRVGKNAVFVLVAVGSLHPSPKVESIKFTVDGREKPTLNTGWALKNSGLKIKEFDSAFILKENTQVLAQVFASATHGATVTDYLYLLGAAYIPEAQLRIQDPADLVGSPTARTTNEIIFTV